MCWLQPLTKANFLALCWVFWPLAPSFFWSAAGPLRSFRWEKGKPVWPPKKSSSLAPMVGRTGFRQAWTVFFLFPKQDQSNFLMCGEWRAVHAGVVYHDCRKKPWTCRKAALVAKEPAIGREKFMQLQNFPLSATQLQVFLQLKAVSIANCRHKNEASVNQARLTYYGNVKVLVFRPFPKISANKNSRQTCQRKLQISHRKKSKRWKGRAPNTRKRNAWQKPKIQFAKSQNRWGQKRIWGLKKEKIQDTSEMSWGRNIVLIEVDLNSGNSSEGNSWNSQPGENFWL